MGNELVSFGEELRSEPVPKTITAPEGVKFAEGEQPPDEGADLFDGDECSDSDEEEIEDEEES